MTEPFMHTISIPFTNELLSEDTWESCDSKHRKFGVTRFHFYIENKVASDYKIGEFVSVYHHPQGPKSTISLTKTTEVEVSDSIKYVETQLTSNETLSKIASEISANPNQLFKSSASSEISERITHSLTMGTEVTGTTIVKESVTFSSSHEFQGNDTNTYFLVKVYAKCCLVVYLGYIDYLTVEYRTTHLGLRKKATKFPIIRDFRNHPNIVKFGVPVADAIYHKLLPLSSFIVKREEYANEVQNPCDVTIKPPSNSKIRHLLCPLKIPSLYKISRMAFPTKWIWRKSQKNDWTKEDLIRLEQDDYDKKWNHPNP